MPHDRDLATEYDICECVRLIEGFVRGLDFGDFVEDERTQSAVILQVLLIGEAAKKLSAGFRQRFPQIPWSEIMRMRDKLIHRYRTLRAGGDSPPTPSAPRPIPARRPPLELDGP